MADLSEFCGEDAIRAGFVKKRDKIQVKLDIEIEKAQKKIAPLQMQVERFNALISVLDEIPGKGKSIEERVAILNGDENE